MFGRTLTAGVLRLVMLALLVGAGTWSVTPSRAGDEAGLRSVVVAGGCFWCVESDFDKVPGVVKTISGYSGGTTKNPNYRSVTYGSSGHLEVVKIVFDPKVVSFERITEIFWRTIDPTDDRGQFCDKGASYRTAIFVKTTGERTIVERQKKMIEDAGTLSRPIVTRILDAAPFYPAETYHQNFYKKSPVRYNSYRRGCRRDDRVRQLWGDQAWGGKPHS